MQEQGPYRETAVVSAREPGHAIVLPGEERPPTRRLRVIDYSDGSMVVRLRHASRIVGMVTLGPWSALCGLVVLLAGVSITGVIYLALSLCSLAGFLWCALPIEELALTRSVVVLRRHAFSRRKEVVLLEDLGRFVVQLVDGAPTLLLQHGERSIPIMYQRKNDAPLTWEQLLWLAARLRRAVKRLRDIEKTST